MKARDHDKIVAGMESRHLAQCTKLRRVSAERLCSYLSPETFSAVCSDLIRTADAGAGPLLTLLTEIKGRRYTPTQPQEAPR